MINLPIHVNDLIDIARHAGRAILSVYGSNFASAVHSSYALLPREELKNLWDEFEKRETADAIFAQALDRLEPIIQNAHTEGHAWMKHGIKKSQVAAINQPKISDGSILLWEYAEALIDKCVSEGFLEE